MKVRMDWRTGSLVAIWFLVGATVYAIIKWGSQYWWDPRVWQVVAAIGTWLLAGGVVFAIRQVQQAKKSTNAQLAVALFDKLREERTKDTLRKIYQLSREQIKDLLDSNEDNKNLRNEIDGLLDKFELLGSLVEQGIIDNRLAMEAFAGPAALRCWYQLVQYIKKEQTKRGFFLENYEDFTRCALDYFKKRQIKVKFSEEGEKENGKDLVVELQKEELCPRSLKEIKRGRKSKKKDEGEA